MTIRPFSASSFRLPSYYEADEKLEDPGEMVREAFDTILCESVVSDPDPEVRAAAAVGLAGCKTPEALEALRKALADPAPNVRLEALRARYGHSLPDDSDLVSYISDEDPEVCAQALGFIGGASWLANVPRLISLVPELIFLARNPSENVRTAAARLLFQAATPESLDAAWQAIFTFPDLLSELRYDATGFDRPGVMAFLARVLSGRTGDTQPAIDAVAKATPSEFRRRILLDALRDPDSDVSDTAASALKDDDDAEVTNALLELWKRVPGSASVLKSLSERPGGAVEAILIQNLRGADDQLAEIALSELKTRPHVRIARAMIDCLSPAFESILGHKEMPRRRWAPEVRFTLLDRIPESWLTLNLPSLMQEGSGRERRFSLDDAPSLARQRGLVDAIAHQESPEVPGLLASALTHPDLNIRCGAILCLGARGGEQVLDALETALKSADDSMRRCAVFALARQPGKRSLDALFSLLNSAENNDSPVLSAAVSALQKRTGDIAAELSKAFESDSEFTRARIIEVAAHLEGSEGKKIAGNLLLKATHDTASRVRLAALTAWPAYDSRRALSACYRALEDPDALVSETAANHLAEDHQSMANRLLGRWAKKILREGPARLTDKRLGVIRRLVAKSDDDLKWGPPLACLLSRAKGDPRIGANASSVLAGVPELWRKRAAEIYRDPGEPEGEAVLDTPDSLNSLRVLPMMLSAAGAVSAGADSATAQLGEMFADMGAETIADSFDLLIRFYGRSVFPAFRSILNRLNIPEPILCGVCLALGRASDAASGAVFVELLTSPSQAVRSAAMDALIELGDLAAPHLAVAAVGRSPNAKVVAKYLLAILAGNEAPILSDLVSQTLLEQRYSPRSEADMERMSFNDHLAELYRRGATVFVGTLAAGLVAAWAVGGKGPIVLAWLYGIAVPAAQAFLSSAGGASWFGVLTAAWVGGPLLLFEVWGFASAGLYSAERTLASRPVMAVAAAATAMPILLMAASRALLHFIPALGDNPPLLIAVADAISVGLGLIAMWAIGLKQVWNWLTLLTDSGYIPNRDGFSFKLYFNPRRSVLLVTATSVVVGCAIPVYWSACFVNGAILQLALWLTILHIYTELRRRRPAGAPAFTRFLSGVVFQFIPGLTAAPLALLLIAALKLAPTHSSALLTALHLNGTSLGIATAEASRNTLLITAWVPSLMAILILLVVALVFSLIRRSRIDLADYGGRLTAGIILFGVGFAFLHRISPRTSLIGLSVALVLAVWIGMRTSLRTIIPVAILLLVCSQLPLAVLSGTLLWLLPAFLILAPAGLDIYLRLPPGVRSSIGEEFARARAEIDRTYEQEIVKQSEEHAPAV